MSRTPQPGDARAAMVAMNARTRAAYGLTDEHPSCTLGSVTTNLKTGESKGPADGPMRLVYGDLFDPGELLAGGAAGVIQSFLLDFAPGDAFSVLCSLYMQAVGTGVLMERLRWERES